MLVIMLLVTYFFRAALDLGAWSDFGRFGNLGDCVLDI